MITVAAGILAGGLSSRMGEDKPAMAWNGRTFLETVRSACCDFREICVSVDDSGKLPGLDCLVVTDELKEYGPLEGLYQILRTIHSEYVFLLAADMPLLRSDFLQAAVSRLTGCEDCLVIRKEGRPQPLCSIYSRRLLPELVRLREHGEHRMRTLFEKGNTVYLDLEELGYGTEVVDNINTPEEYEKICMTYGRRMEEFAPALLKRLQRENVLVCYLDGFGYEMYRYAFRNGRIPFISSHFLITPVRTVQPPLTNPAMATMITGVSPDVHGVHSHKERMLEVPTVFAGRSGSNTAFLEGDTRILVTELSPVLHPARLGRGCDEWIADDAVKASSLHIPFIFAHFHEIDDKAHESGPYSEACMKQIEAADGQVRRIAQVFDGRMIIISDHGVTDGENGGIHGQIGDSFENPEEMLAVWGEENAAGRV